MTTYEAKGRVISAGETRIVGQNGFQVRDIVVDVSEGQYPNLCQFTFKKDRCAKADGLKEGDAVSVTFTIDGRKWDGPNGTKYFTTLTGWDIANETPHLAAKDQPPVVDAAADEDSLPF